MAIIEEEFELDLENEENQLKVSKIDDFIKSRGIIPVRYSLVSREHNKIKLNVSGIKK